MSFDVLVYGNDDGVSPVLEFLGDLSPKELAKCLAYIALLQEHGNKLTSQFIKHLESCLWELRAGAWWRGNKALLFHVGFKCDCFRTWLKEKVGSGSPARNRTRIEKNGRDTKCPS